MSLISGGRKGLILSPAPIRQHRGDIIIDIIIDTTIIISKGRVGRRLVGDPLRGFLPCGCGVGGVWRRPRVEKGEGAFKALDPQKRAFLRARLAFWRPLGP